MSLEQSEASLCHGAGRDRAVFGIGAGGVRTLTQLTRNSPPRPSSSDKVYRRDDREIARSRSVPHSSEGLPRRRRGWTPALCFLERPRAGVPPKNNTAARSILRGVGGFGGVVARSRRRFHMWKVSIPCSRMPGGKPSASFVVGQMALQLYLSVTGGYSSRLFCATPQPMQ
jgi:hypothetical protein